MVSPVNRQLINKMFQSRHGITSKQTPNKQMFQSKHGIISKQTTNKTNASI
jgi:hypothetical protein